MVRLIMIFIIGYAVAQDSDCDHTQNVAPEALHYFNESYSAGRMCKYVGICPGGYHCRLDCYISMPLSTKCSADRLLLSKSGDPELNGAEAYCGAQKLSAVSSDTSISFGLVIPKSSPGGNVTCALSAQRMPFVPARNTSCRCGERKKTRIVGGEEVQTNEYPMIAAIVHNSIKVDENKEWIYCGGVIISSRYVMTAAHCVLPYQWNPSALYVAVGSHHVGNISMECRYKIFRFIIHEKYIEDIYDYDIALVVLKRKIQFSESTLPACLPFSYKDQDLAGETVTILGWGTTSFGGEKSEALLKVDVKVIGQEKCRASAGNITDRHICTYTRGKDACQYDSGGPLLLEAPSGLVFAVGVVSHGSSCALGSPGVSTRVSTLLGWINKYARDQFCYK